MGRFDWPYDELDVLAFARAMIRGGYAEFAESDYRCYLLIDLIERPYKWRVELDAWAATGRPDSFDPTEDLTTAQ
jgi:hypothetical protein